MLTSSSSLQAYALRLRPGDDLRPLLPAFVAAHRVEAGAVLTCVGGHLPDGCRVIYHRKAGAGRTAGVAL